MQHGTSPDDGLVAGIEKSDGYDFQAEGFDGLDSIVPDHARLRVDAQHEGNVRTVHIGIE